MTPELNNSSVERLIKQLVPKIRLKVYRGDPTETAAIDVDVTKKSGKMLGIELSEATQQGIIISDVVIGCDQHVYEPMI